MCGRITQYRHTSEYRLPELVDGSYLAFDEADRPAGFNVSPGTHPLALYPDGGVRRIFWGYRPAWAAAKKLPPMINARADKITGSAWKGMLARNRVIVPADGWYEWILADDGKKQPFYLKPRDGLPLYFAALSSAKPDADAPPRAPDERPAVVDGLVIVTDASDKGMLDVHDRRPVALTFDNARLWLHAETPVEMAAAIARTASRPTDDFEWEKVSREVNRPTADRPDLIEPI
ncbi:MAG: SOS response-associated peptidase [Janthinobacterium lividum]